MRTNLIVPAIASGINDTLAALVFSSFGGRCNSIWGENCGDAQQQAGEFCPTWEWNLAPRVCGGNLIQDPVASLNPRRVTRQMFKFLIQHENWQLEFELYGFPDFLQLYSHNYGRGLYAISNDGDNYDWALYPDFVLSKIGDEDAGPTKLPIRRGRMPHHGEADRRASRTKSDNSWKRHRGTQWR
jgi:hypothetical protein